MAPGQADHADSAGHPVIGDLQYCGRRAVGVQFQRPADRINKALAQALHGDAAIHRQHGVGVQTAQGQIGIGDGRLRTTLAITDGSRYGARRTRTDLQHARIIDEGD